MSATVLTIAAAKDAKIRVIENGRGTQALHDVVVALRANRRSGSANTKTKAEVVYSGKKPWRQKGTGRARAGYTSSPVWSGGGVAFGPKPRDYSRNVPRRIRCLALLKALSSRIIAGDVLIAEHIKVATPKTKEFISFLKSQTEERKVLLVATQFDDATYKAARNIQPVLLNTAAEVNTEQLLAFRKIIVTREALARLAERLA
ncbi:MAG: 50S ribosomal protein L4 [Verrucomicrobia bacterium]|nr:50S ribosomal protein L4 [Verrucomicrobiota bacterium]MBV9130631.1 50S ribosomal protein L4 [Verrucomicrobiota bacterium]MBV9298313.1 50S ribosomal protein L4 [Verrucomicrobiota bacterium]MBV9645529.1 50S ribosomal protein L4 [Verrucomicrobiota bacterium]